MAVLTDAEIQQRLATVPGWRYENGLLVRTLKSGDFVGSMARLTQVALLAQAQDHHPDLELSWDTLTIKVATHDQGGITEKDFRLAAAVEALGKE